MERLQATHRAGQAYRLRPKIVHLGMCSVESSYTVTVPTELGGCSRMRHQYCTITDIEIKPNVAITINDRELAIKEYFLMTNLDLSRTNYFDNVREI
jgi:hypothetical protein